MADDALPTPPWRGLEGSAVEPATDYGDAGSRTLGRAVQHEVLRQAGTAAGGYAADASGGVNLNALVNPADPLRSHDLDELLEVFYFSGHIFLDLTGRFLKSVLRLKFISTITPSV